MEVDLQKKREEHAQLEQQLHEGRLEAAKIQPDSVGGSKVALDQAQKLLDNFKSWAPEGENGNTSRQAAVVLEAEVQRQRAAAEAAQKAKQEAKRGLTETY